MTNDLMRDVIEGRIPVARRPFAAGGLITRPSAIKPATKEAFWSQWAGFELTEWQLALLDKIFMPPPTKPADPRERALWAKQERGTGPDVGAPRERGRVTKYKEKR